MSADRSIPDVPERGPLGPLVARWSCPVSVDGIELRSRNFRAGLPRQLLLFDITAIFGEITLWRLRTAWCCRCELRRRQRQTDGWHSLRHL